MIVVLEYHGESRASKKNIRQEAESIKTKVEEKTKKYGKDWNEKLITTADELRAYLKDPASRREKKMHIVCHGNQAQVGNYNASALGEFLWGAGLKDRENIKKISLHSCDSGVEVVDPGNNSWTPSLAWQLAAYFASKGRKRMFVRGADGHSFTDSQGRNWVLMDGMEMEKTPNRERELGFIERSTKPRRTARPRFVTEYGGGVSKA